MIIQGIDSGEEEKNMSRRLCQKPSLLATSLTLNFIMSICLLWTVSNSRQASVNFVRSTQLKNVPAQMDGSELNEWMNKKPQEVLSGRNMVKENGQKVGLDLKKRLPGVIVIGFEYCGTDDLSLFLRKHPNIAHSNPKGLYYWNNHKNESLEWYRNLMPISSQYQVTMEYTPNYIFDRHIPFLIRKNFPTMKLIVMIRDPIQRSVCHVMNLKEIPRFRKIMTRRPGDQPFAFLNDSFEETVLKPNGEIFKDNAVIENGKYVDYLQYWFEFFPRDNFLIIDEDVLKADPVSVLQNVEDFLEIPRYFDRNRIYFDKGRNLHCISGQSNSCLDMTIGRTDPIEQDIQDKLKEYYHPYNIKLENVLHRKFTWT